MTVIPISKVKSIFNKSTKTSRTIHTVFVPQFATSSKRTKKLDTLRCLSIGTPPSPVPPYQFPPPHTATRRNTPQPPQRSNHQGPQYAENTQ